MKPIIIIPEGAMSAESIKELRDNGICVVEAKDPACVKFLDPIPAAQGRTNVEDAAIQLSRKILNKGFWNEHPGANLSPVHPEGHEARRGTVRGRTGKAHRQCRPT